MDIELGVRGLKGGRAGALSVMCTEDIKGCIWEAKRNKYPVSRRWELAVRIIQMAFGDRILPEDIISKNGPLP